MLTRVFQKNRCSSVISVAEVVVKVALPIVPYRRTVALQIRTIKQRMPAQIQAKVRNHTLSIGILSLLMF